MKAIKIIFISVEIACIIAVIILSFTSVDEDAEIIKAIYTSLFCMLSVVMQREQQSIDWNEE
jgi:hypothetical protein